MSCQGDFLRQRVGVRSYLHKNLSTTGIVFGPLEAPLSRQAPWLLLSNPWCKMPGYSYNGVIEIECSTGMRLAEGW